MKTSKIIFTALLGAILLIIVADAIDLRIHGSKNADGVYKTNKQEVPAFKVLCLNDIRDVALFKSDSSCIVESYLNDSIIARLNYAVKDDTLTVTDQLINKKRLPVTIRFTKSLNKIYLKNSKITINSFDKLSFVADQSTIRFNQDKNYALSWLDILARNHSNITANNFKVDSLKIMLENSQASLVLDANKISGSVSENSKINLRQPLELSLRRDSTSTVYVNRY